MKVSGSWASVTKQAKDITPEPQYLVVANFVRYYTRTKISLGYRIHEIFADTLTNSRSGQQDK